MCRARGGLIKHGFEHMHEKKTVRMVKRCRTQAEPFSMMVIVFDNRWSRHAQNLILFEFQEPHLFELANHVSTGEAHGSVKKRDSMPFHQNYTTCTS